MAVNFFKLLSVFILLLFTTILAQTKVDKIFKYGDFGEPETLEPLTAAKSSEHHLCQFTFDSLVTQSSKGDFIFSLATGLDISPDGLSYTFILRKSLKWADGTALTTRDVEFTLALLLNPRTDNHNAKLAKYIEDVVCINPRMIMITLSRPFYSPLSLFVFKILPKHKFTQDYLQRSNSFTKNPLGCGPYKYAAAYKTGITLEQNSFFSHRHKPFLQKIKVKFYRDKKKASSDLLRKKLHLVTELQPSDIPNVERHQDFKLKRYRTRKIHFIAFNYHQHSRHRQLFQDYRFRRALLHAIKRKAILQKIFFAGSSNDNKDGQAHALISGPFPVNSWAYNDKIEPLPYNLSYAQQLMREVLRRKGYRQNDKQFWQKQGKILSFSLKYFVGDQAVEQSCQWVAKSFGKLGLLLKLEARTESAFIKEVWQQQQFDLVYAKYDFDNTIDVYPLFDHSRIGKGQSNFSGYVDSQLMELFSQLHNTLNPWRLRSLSHKIHKAIHDKTVHLFLWQLDLYAAHHKSLKNFKSHPYRLFHFPESWKIIHD